MTRLSRKSRTAVLAVACAVGVGAVAASPLLAAPKAKKESIAYLTTKHGKCKSGYQKIKLHSGKGKKKVVDYTCVLVKTKTKTKTVQSPYKAANSVIVGSGSNTAYSVIASLDGVFNGLQGCNPIESGSAPQPLDFSCPKGSLNGISGSSPQSLNPVNDVAAEEPAIGGSAGVSQLEEQGCQPAKSSCSHLPSYANGNVAAINYATTVSSPSTSQDEGLNYVAFAEDGLSWFHFTSVDGTPSASASYTDLSTTDLQGIWNGTITNWDQITDEGPPAASAPIKVYTASAGAGVRSVWEKFLGESSGGSSTYIESQGASYANSHIIPQNEDQDIIKNGDESNAIFFFSVGRFSVLCGDGTNSDCTDGKSGSSVALGSIDGVAPTAANIYSKTFTPTLKLYTVYSNGSNPLIAPATQATLNLVSEDGFLCRSDSGIVDPTNGHTVRQDIDTAILQNGFLPLDQSTLGPNGVASAAQVSTFAEGGVPHPAHITASPYKSYDLSGSNPKGYCTVSTTDGVSTTK
jgi:hypothetical protein